MAGQNLPVLFLHGLGCHDQSRDKVLVALRASLPADVPIWAPSYYGTLYEEDGGEGQKFGRPVSMTVVSGWTVSGAINALASYIPQRYRKFATRALGTPPSTSPSSSSSFTPSCKDHDQKGPPSKCHVVGYSFGGLLAALLAEKHPELVASLLLLAPAIDSFERNFAHVARSNWHRSATYVDDLRKWAARPSLGMCPTVVVHGLGDNDHCGGKVDRIQEWLKTEKRRNQTSTSGGGTSNIQAFFPDIDHGLHPWLQADRDAKGTCVKVAQCTVEGVPPFHELVYNAIIGKRD